MTSCVQLDCEEKLLGYDIKSLIKDYDKHYSHP